jgi:sulfite dehydrogenase (cytochrome) subunit B
MRGQAALIALGFAALACSAAAAPDPAVATPPPAVTLKAGPGQDLTAGLCMICHSLEYIPANAPAMNRGAWQKSIQKMRERFGAPISDEQAQLILEYLAANYSRKP